MKKLILFLLLLLPIPALAQVSTTTPNLGLTKPCVAGDPGCAPSGDPNWGPKINGNFDILDARVPKPTPARVTVATKPSGPTLNEIVVVTDGLGATDCNVAGGSNNVTCQWTGTAWVPVGGGAGGGGGSTAFSSITSGANKTATMVVDSGASLATSGTGTITATAVPLTGVTGQTSLVKNNQSNAFSTGDQNFANASSFTFPIAPGATPTISGRCAYDSTGNVYKCGVNGSTITLPSLNAVQPLSPLLTAFANLSLGPPAAGQIPYFMSGSTLGLAQAILCTDTAGQHLNITSINPLTFSCGNSGTGSISGLTTGKMPKAASATTLTDSIISESAGVATVGGGFVVGTGPYLVLNTAAITPSDITWTVLNFSGTVRPSSGVITAGHNITVDANGLLVDNGAAGSGTATDSSVKTFTNLTLDAEATGNAITLPVEFGGDLVGCIDVSGSATASNIWNKDPLSTAPTPTCVSGTNRTIGVAAFPDSDGDYGVQLTKVLPTGFTGALDAEVWWNTTGTGNARFQFQTKCYASNAADDAAFNTASVVTAAAGTSGRPNRQAITGITITGCAANQLMRVRFFRNRTEGSDTLNAALNVEQVVFTMRVTR